MIHPLTHTREGIVAGAVAGGIIFAAPVFNICIPASESIISLLTDTREGSVTGAVAGGIIVAVPVFLSRIPAPESSKSKQNYDDPCI